MQFPSYHQQEYSFLQQQWCVKEVMVLVTDFKLLLENFH